MKETINKT